MKERQILFNDQMIRAILEGTKTQTRRIVKMKQSDWCKEIKGDCWHPNDIVEWRLQNGRWFGLMGWYTLAFADCPYGQPGDRLWVREAWRVGDSGDCACYEPCGRCPVGKTLFRADFPNGVEGWKWKPSIHMPRCASRILLEITGVRVERLKDISEQDAKAEGVGQTGIETGQVLENSAPVEIGSYAATFCDLWESINGPGSWDANPWVWVIEFRGIK